MCREPIWRGVLRAAAYWAVSFVVVFVVAQVLANVADWTTVLAQPFSPNQWPYEVPSGWAARPDRAVRRTLLGAQSSCYTSQYGDDPEAALHCQLQIESAGWPCYSFAGWMTFVYSGKNMPSGVDSHDMIGTELLGHKAVVLMKPLWIGLITNTSALAAALWLAERCVRMYRHRSRSRRHRCTQCGYDLRQPTGDSMSRCPECGRSVNAGGERVG